MTLDSSEVLRAENYQGKIHEVALLKEMAFPSLEESLIHARSEGYVYTHFGIANILHGAPDKNEPRAVIYLNRDNPTGQWLREKNLGHALITQYKELSLFYGQDCFRFIP